jgi:hypothetical protein
MQDMDSHNKPACPHASGATAAPHRDDAPPAPRLPLSRLSEVERDAAPDSPMRRIASWIHEFLAQPHPDVGRRGAVCPFVPLSLEMDTIWMTEVRQPDPTFDDVAALITALRDQFIAMEPVSGPEAMQKSILVVLPTLVHNASMVDEIQRTLKRHFVDVGLMLGEFHAANESPGLRNPDFRPLRTPVPMLAIRYMVESDLPFLMRDSTPAAERSSFLRSYLSHMGRGLTINKFELALNRLVAAEIEVWIAAATAAGHVQAAMLPMPGQALREAKRGPVLSMGASR